MATLEYPERFTRGTCGRCVRAAVGTSVLVKRRGIHVRVNKVIWKERITVLGNMAS